MNNLENLVLKNIDLYASKVTYNDFQINPTLPFEMQEWSFKEDLLQIECAEKIIVDLGWYPEFEAEGNFTIVAIKNYNWHNPIFIKKTNDYHLMKQYLQEALDYVNALVNGEIS